MNRILLFLILLPFFSFSQWSQVGVDIDGASGERMGTSVSLSSDGSIVAMGAPFSNSQTGAVRVYGNNSGTWAQVGSDILGVAVNDNFGQTVSLSGDGFILAIGAPGYDNSGSNNGLVRVYENVGGVWTQMGADIIGASGNQFGFSVSLSKDGSLLALGAIGYDSSRGLMRIYKNIGGVWTQQGGDIVGESANDIFGYSVSLSGDGSRVAGTAIFNDWNGTDSGHARVYYLDSGVWTQIGLDIDGEYAFDQSGISVDLNNDGTVIAIGAINNDANGSDSGHVRVFVSVLNSWLQSGADFDGSNAGDYFGQSVSLSDDGSILAVGETRANLNKGQVKIYQNVSSVWGQLGNTIVGSLSGGQFGSSVSLSNDGAYLGVGVKLDNANGSQSGSVGVYKEASLSISHNTFGTGFNVYPNPISQGRSTINFGANYAEVTVSIFDVLGKNIKKRAYYNTDNIALPVENLTTGVYIVQVHSENKKANLRLVVE